jgi:hypothetical protein
MPTAANALRFNDLRSWDGSQSRAFEELSYQLLRSSAPSSANVIRTGNPDGGVEWYATLSDGSEFGWQAKHYQSFSGLLPAMTASVRRVVAERPQLRKLTFVISSNLATGTHGNARKSQRQKYDDILTSWRESIPGASNIEYELVQGSELLFELAKPEHRGRAWFWWNSTVFNEDWLRRRLDEQAVAAGPKYRPDLQVDLPIEDDLKALGFGETAVRRFESLRKSIVASALEVRVRPSGPEDLMKLHRLIAKRARSLIDVLSSFSVDASTRANAFTPLRAALDKFLEAIYDGESMERNLIIDWQERQRSDPEFAEESPPSEVLSYRVREVRDLADELDTWLGSTAGQAFQNHFYFLLGPAGSGKTHLFLDATRRAIEEGRPAVTLVGARFGNGDLWASVCDQLGLENLGSDVLLGAMNAAAEATELLGRRFVIHIDALNETVQPTFWRANLPAVRAAISLWPNVALAVSCRDTYVNVIEEGTERAKYVQQTHPGFAGREIEATQKYFAHYELEAPRIPLLVPEFTMPLFLSMYCESLQASGEDFTSIGHEGRVRIFERYLKTKVSQVARRLTGPIGSNFELVAAQQRVTAVVDALLAVLVDEGNEGISVDRAQAVAREVLDGMSQSPEATLGALQDERVFTHEQLYLGGDSYVDGLRISFQAFADYLLLRRRLALSSSPLDDDEFKVWLRERSSWGIREAATVVLPELYEVELLDFLGITSQTLKWPGRNATPAKRRNHGEAFNLFEAFVRNLPYRSTYAVTQRTIELLNQAIPAIQDEQILHALFQVAPQPGNLLNAKTLHRYLGQFPMPRRDRFFGFSTFHELEDEASPASTLARWASAGPYPTYDPDVVELACIPLVWLLSSSNRFMRDWTTKSLVQLLRGHLDVLLRLINDFWLINDPYVVQRLFVVAYGSLLRSVDSDDETARTLIARVRELAFTQPVRADELLLDAARGIIEIGVRRGLMNSSDSTVITRPYGISAPTNPPTTEKLREKYGYKEHVPDEESYSLIFSSILGLGDFGRNYIESGMRKFSRYRDGRTYPANEPAKQPRLIKYRWIAFEKSLSPEQLDLFFAAFAEMEGGTATHPSPSLDEFHASLSDMQSQLLSQAWTSPRRPKQRNDEYPVEQAKRWVMRRTVTLGWKPSLFGFQDRVIDRGSAREGRKIERWGQKYQWIAYHELLARVADNFQTSRSNYEDWPYEGLHQLIGQREIDPSLPPTDFRSIVEGEGNDSAPWPPSPIAFPGWPETNVDFTRYRGDADSFLADQTSEPSFEKIAKGDDGDGETWILLKYDSEESDPLAPSRWTGLRQSVAVSSIFVPREDSSRLLPHLPRLRELDRWQLDDYNGHVDCCYFREIGWTSHHCDNSHRELEELGHDDSGARFVKALEGYQWEGSLLDGSIRDSVHAVAPSYFLQSRTELTPEDCGPSWRDASGTIVLTAISRRPNRTTAFAARGAWLMRFLQDNALDLMLVSWHERRYLAGQSNHQYPWEMVFSAAKVSADLTIEVAPTIRTSY